MIWHCSRHSISRKSDPPLAYKTEVQSLNNLVDHFKHCSSNPVEMTTPSLLSRDPRLLRVLAKKKNHQRRDHDLLFEIFWNLIHTNNLDRPKRGMLLDRKRKFGVHQSDLQSPNV